MIRLRIQYFLLFSILLLINLGCKDSAKETLDNPEQLLSEQATGTADSEWTTGGKAFGIFHEVEDYNNWKPVFDQDEPRRNNAGFEFLDILCSVENENNLAVFFMTPDHKSAKDFISDDLRDKMEEAGVKSVPSFIMYDLVFLTNADYGSYPYRIAISYKVRKYDDWYSKFIANRKSRLADGVYDIGMARSPDSPRMVYTMMATKSIEEANAFLNTEGSAERMLEYNVAGDPTLSLWKRAEYRNPN